MIFFDLFDALWFPLIAGLVSLVVFHRLCGKSRKKLLDFSFSISHFSSPTHPSLGVWLPVFVFADSWIARVPAFVSCRYFHIVGGTITIFFKMLCR